MVLRLRVYGFRAFERMIRGFKGWGNHVHDRLQRLHVPLQ